jgi:hypothetical protein
LAVLLSTAMLRAAAVLAALDFTAVVRAPAGRLTVAGRGAAEPAAVFSVVARGADSSDAVPSDTAFTDLVAVFLVAGVLGAALRTRAVPEESVAAAVPFDAADLVFLSAADGAAAVFVAAEPAVVGLPVVGFAGVDFADVDLAGAFGVPSSFTARARGALGAAVLPAGAAPW